jgi:hypothetical protein
MNWLLRRSVLAPVRRLRDAMGRVGAGKRRRDRAP